MQKWQKKTKQEKQEKEKIRTKKFTFRDPQQ